jgi:hypothetical protein
MKKILLKISPVVAAFALIACDADNQLNPMTPEDCKLQTNAPGCYKKFAGGNNFKFLGFALGPSGCNNFVVDHPRARYCPAPGTRAEVCDIKALSCTSATGARLEYVKCRNGNDAVSYRSYYFGTLFNIDTCSQ